MVSQTSPLAGMKPKDAIKLGTVPLDIQNKPYYPNMGYADTFISMANNMEVKKDGQQTSFGVEIRIDCIELYKTQVIGSCIIWKMDMIELLYVKN